MNTQNDKLIHSIEKKINSHIENGLSIHEALCQITQSELYSLLLFVTDSNVLKKSTSQLLQEFKSSSYTPSSTISQNQFLVFDMTLIDILPATYESIELSPISILGSNKVTHTSQKKIISTIRNLEIVWDSCIQLAYHHLQNNKPNEDRDYATSHRLVRNQNFKNSQYTNHFRMLSLGSHINGSNIFLHLDKLTEHIDIIVKWLESAKLKNIISYDKIIVELSNIKHFNQISDYHKNILLQDIRNKNIEMRENIESYQRDMNNNMDNIIAFLNNIWYKNIEKIIKDYAILENSLQKIKAHNSECDVSIDYNRLHWTWHYNSYCYHISIKKDNKIVTVADWWISNRTGQLMSNEKSAFVVSGLGTETILKLF